MRSIQNLQSVFREKVNAPVLLPLTQAAPFNSVCHRAGGTRELLERPTWRRTLPLRPESMQAETRTMTRLKRRKENHLEDESQNLHRCESLLLLMSHRVPGQTGEKWSGPRFRKPSFNTRYCSTTCSHSLSYVYTGLKRQPHLYQFLTFIKTKLL